VKPKEETPKQKFSFIHETKPANPGTPQNNQPSTNAEKPAEEKKPAEPPKEQQKGAFPSIVFPTT